MVTVKPQRSQRYRVNSTHNTPLRTRMPLPRGTRYRIGDTPGVRSLSQLPPGEPGELAVRGFLPPVPTWTMGIMDVLEPPLHGADENLGPVDHMEGAFLSRHGATSSAVAPFPGCVRPHADRGTWGPRRTRCWQRPRTRNTPHRAPRGSLVASFEPPFSHPAFVPDGFECQEKETPILPDLGAGGPANGNGHSVPPERASM